MTRISALPGILLFEFLEDGSHLPAGNTIVCPKVDQKRFSAGEGLFKLIFGI